MRWWAAILAPAAVIGAAGCGSGDEMPDGDEPDMVIDAGPAEDAADEVPEPPGPEDIAARMLVPATVPAEGGALPIVVRFSDAETGSPLGLVTTVTLAASPGVELGPASELAVRRDVGSVTARLGAIEGAFTVGIAELPHVAPVTVDVVEEPDWQEVEGTLDDGELQWGPGGFIEVGESVVVPEGETLTIGAGTRVRIADEANIDVEGDLVVEGTAEEPVVFEPEDTAWGGLRHEGEARYSYALFVGGGGDESREFGHSDSQPVIHAEPGAHVMLDHVAIQDGPGKAVGALEAVFEMTDSVIARTDTGGELETAEVYVARTHFFDFPDRDAPQADDDNDALYLDGTLVRDAMPVKSLIEDCVFMHGLDDGLDHKGATVEVRRSRFEGFTNEGIACSEAGSVHVSDSVMTGNGQGLEAGYGAPAVTAEHVLIFGNEVGARYGDSYRDVYYGTLNITGSVIAGNSMHAVWNHVLSTDGPKEDAVRVTRSVVSGPARAEDLGEGVITEAPEIGTDGLLAPGSAGSGAAADGMDMGLLTPQPTLVLDLASKQQPHPREPTRAQP